MLRAAASAAWRAAIDLVFPRACVGCGRAGLSLCDRCAQAVLPLLPPICPRCGQPLESPGLCGGCRGLATSPLAMARAAALHEEPLRAAIHALKYEGRTELAPLLARHLVAALLVDEWRPVLPRIDAVVPVPLHAQRLAERGYNQSGLLAASLCESLQVTLAPDWIERHRDTRPQVGLNAAERAGNVVDSFTAAAAVRGRRILLIDDVYTTGATLRSCAQAACDAGAVEVFALTLARPLLVPHGTPLP